MEVEVEKLKKRISEIRINLEKIKRYSSLPDEDFWKDERNILSLKHLLLETIEATGSICTHILAKKILKPVSSFGECFKSLGDANVLSPELSKRLLRMSGFRNILVHRYWEIQDKKVLEYARRDLRDFEDFLETVIKYIGLQKE
jgi:uncharacterized protein YutE (UPF0331/DUF86 family)